jgi:hypothetical protein
MFRRFPSCRGVAIGLIATLGVMVGCGGDSPTGPSAPPAAGFTVSTISPNTGGLGGATSVTIHGTGFQVGATVTFDGAVATATVNSSTVIVASTPVHAAGRVDIAVVNPDGQSSKLAGGFTYILEPASASLSIRAMTPQPGSTAGGSSVTITGTGIQSGATVTVGGAVTEATSYDGSMYLITPAHAAGIVDVVVTNPGGQSASLPGGYTYASPESFDFNGEWEAGAHETPIRFTIRNNTLVSLSCGTSAPVMFSTAPVVTQGEFSFAGDDGIAVTGRIVSASAATGTINIGACAATTWYAFKQ